MSTLGSENVTTTAYATAPRYGAGFASPRNGLGTTALVLGIIAILSSWTVIGGIVLGLAAVGFGIAGRARANRGEATNGGSATAGIVTGIIGVVLSGALIAFGISVLNSPAGKTLESCLRAAGSNHAAVVQCNTQYQNNH